MENERKKFYIAVFTIILMIGGLAVFSHRYVSEIEAPVEAIDVSSIIKEIEDVEPDTVIRTRTYYSDQPEEVAGTIRGTKIEEKPIEKPKSKPQPKKKSVVKKRKILKKKKSTTTNKTYYYYDDGQTPWSKQYIRKLIGEKPKNDG